jgi:hypothetical protein
MKSCAKLLLVLGVLWAAISFALPGTNQRTHPRAYPQQRASGGGTPATGCLVNSSNVNDCEVNG